jgi:hypothetical protein
MASLDQLIRKADAAIGPLQIERRVRREVKAILKQGLPRLARIYVPLKSSEIPSPHLPAIVVGLPVVGLPEYRVPDETGTLQRATIPGGDSGAIGNALIWCLPNSTAQLYAAARNHLVWEGVQAETSRLGTKGSQHFRVPVNIGLGETRGALRQAVWQAYSAVFVPTNRGFSRIDLGVFYSSMAETLVGYIVFRLIHDGHLSENLSRRLEALGR